MEQLLSQAEIDALLGVISSEGVETVECTEPEVAVRREQPFNFATHTKGRTERFSAVEFIADRLSKSLRSALTLFLEREVDINITPTQYIEYGEFVKTLPLPTNMNIVITDNLKGFFMVIFDAKLIFCVLEIVFGSSSITVAKIEGREFTKIEFNIIKKLVDVVSLEMEKAWEPVYEIRCKYSRSEINPNYITMVSPEEMVVVLELSIEIADTTSWMKICIPYGILETIKGYLVSTPSREDTEMRAKWFRRLQESVNEVPLELRAVLGKKKLTVQDFLKIREGTVILTDTIKSEPIELTIMNAPKMKGSMGAFRGNRAIRVKQILD